MDIHSFISNFEQAIDGVEPGSMTADTEFQKIEQWDSLAFLSILAMLDVEYNVEISGARINACHTVGELFTLVCAEK